MKAILYSLMVVALVGGMVGGGLFAYFSDVETSSGNTFEAGTIDITVDGGGVFSNGSQTEFKPCEWGYIELIIKNVGTNPADVYKHIIEAVGEDNGVTEPECEACGGTWDNATGTCAGSYVEDNVTAEDFSFDLTVNDVVWVDPAQEMPLADVICKYIFLGELAPGDTMTVIQSLHLMDTGEEQNELQSDILILNEEFVAFQVPGDAAPAAGDILDLRP